MKITFIFYTVAVLVLLFSTAFSDEIELSDGTIYTGKIVKETGSTLLFQSENGLFEIKRDDIINIRFAEQWGIEDHVVLRDDGSAQKNETKPGQESALEPIFFPLKDGMKWVYNVRYRPHDAAGSQMAEHKRFFQETWSLHEAEDIRGSFYFAQFEQNVGPIYRLIISSSEPDSSLTSKILFVGAADEHDLYCYLVMTDEEVAREQIFYERLMPVNPFLRAQKEWKDIGQENNAFFYAQSTIVGVEGIDTDAGYFEDCLVVNHTYTIENQKVFSEVYIWYAPEVGMVKMVQDINYPDDDNSNGTAKVLQEYDLVEYGVQ